MANARIDVWYGLLIFMLDIFVENGSVHSVVTEGGAGLAVDPFNVHPKETAAEALDVSGPTLKKNADEAIEKGMPVRWEKVNRRIYVSLRKVAE